MRNVDLILSNNSLRMPSLLQEAQERLNNEPENPFEAFEKIFRLFQIKQKRVKELFDAAVRVEDIFRDFPESLEKVRPSAAVYRASVLKVSEVFQNVSTSKDKIEALRAVVHSYELFKPIHNSEFRFAKAQLGSALRFRCRYFHH